MPQPPRHFAAARCRPRASGRLSAFGLSSLFFNYFPVFFGLPLDFSRIPEYNEYNVESNDN